MYVKEFVLVVNMMYIFIEKCNLIGVYLIWKEKKDFNLLGKIGYYIGVWLKLVCFKYVIDLLRGERCFIIFIIIRIKYFESRWGIVYICICLWCNYCYDLLFS